MPPGNVTEMTQAERDDARALARRRASVPRMLEIVAAGLPLPSPASRRPPRRRPSPPSARSSRSRTGSSTAAGAASRTGSRGATANSGSGRRTRPAIRPPGELAALPGRDQRDGAALPVRPLRLRLEGGSPRRQPLRDGRRRRRAARRARPADAVGGRAADLVPGDLTGFVTFPCGLSCACLTPAMSLGRRRAIKPPRAPVVDESSALCARALTPDVSRRPCRAPRFPCAFRARV